MKSNILKLLTIKLCFLMLFCYTTFAQNNNINVYTPTVYNTNSPTIKNELNVTSQNASCNKDNINKFYCKLNVGSKPIYINKYFDYQPPTYRIDVYTDLNYITVNIKPRYRLLYKYFNKDYDNFRTNYLPFYLGYSYNHNVKLNDVMINNYKDIAVNSNLSFGNLTYYIPMSSLKEGNNQLYFNINNNNVNRFWDGSGCYEYGVNVCSLVKIPHVPQNFDMQMSVFKPLTPPIVHLKVRVIKD